jgi:hypothetical protein
MNWAEITIIVLLGINLLYEAYKHSEPKEGLYNIWLKLLATGISVFLYIKAGLFIH